MDDPGRRLVVVLRVLVRCLYHLARTLLEVLWHPLVDLDLDLPVGLDDDTQGVCRLGRVGGPFIGPRRAFVTSQLKHKSNAALRVSSDNAHDPTLVPSRVSLPPSGL